MWYITLGVGDRVLVQRRSSNAYYPTGAAVLRHDGKNGGSDCWSISRGNSHSDVYSCLRVLKETEGFR